MYIILLFIYSLLYIYVTGPGKNHSDAASVRTSHPIPVSCGIYYFEVKIISKGRDGYMGIGLTAQTFKMNRLPGKCLYLYYIGTELVVIITINTKWQ